MKETYTVKVNVTKVRQDMNDNEDMTRAALESVFSKQMVDQIILKAKDPKELEVAEWASIRYEDAMPTQGDTK